MTGARGRISSLGLWNIEAAGRAISSLRTLENLRAGVDFFLRAEAVSSVDIADSDRWKICRPGDLLSSRGISIPHARAMILLDFLLRFGAPKLDNREQRESGDSRGTIPACFQTNQEWRIFGFRCGGLRVSLSLCSLAVARSFSTPPERAHRTLTILGSGNYLARATNSGFLNRPSVLCETSQGFLPSVSLATPGITEQGYTMTRKDFELLAAVFSDCESIFDDTPLARVDHLVALELTVEKTAARLKQTHPRFNEAKFLAAALPIKYAALKQSILRKIEGEQNV
jgi:hypothetical protein